MKAEEIESDQALRGLGVLLSAFFFYSFAGWNVDLAFGRAAARFATALPMAGMQGLSSWIQLWPSPWIRVLFQFLGLLSLVAAVGFLQPGRSRRALRLLAGLWMVKLLAYSLDLRQMSAVHHLHLFFTALFLTGGQRGLWMQLGVGAACWMEALVKLSPSWLLGDCFYSSPSGMPLVPHSLWLIRAFCWSILALLVLAPLALTSSRPRLRRAAVLGLIAYQVYAGLMLGLSYSALMVPLVLLVFHGGARVARPARDPRLLLLGGALLAAGWSLIIPGDVRYTAEGRYLSLSGAEVGYRSRAVLRVGKARHRWEIRMEWSAPDASQAQAFQAQVLRDGKLVPTAAQSLRGRVFYNPGYFSSLPARLQNDPYVYVHWANRVQRLTRPDQLSVDLWTRLDSQQEEVQTLHLPDLARRTPAYLSLWHNDWVALPGGDAAAPQR